jgi:hypothetical protein
MLVKVKPEAVIVKEMKRGRRSEELAKEKTLRLKAPNGGV